MSKACGGVFTAKASVGGVLFVPRLPSLFWSSDFNFNDTQVPIHLSRAGDWWHGTPVSPGLFSLSSCREVWIPQGP